jgi:asparagine synthase (glutamine-hydrolysing)
MCGIAGTVNWGDQSVAARMTDVQSHRGPDDQGTIYFPDERVSLGHRRLSIIDLSPAGHQPMSNDDQTVWITFNGEIYNFLELRSELEKQGAKFKSKSDTEVIIRLYERYGNDCVKHLNGMFAFAIFDKGKRKLLLARDHCGIKPLYYYANSGKFAFASEIKAILASGIYSPEINWQALHDYLTYLYVPCPDTMFRGIYQVPPAHTLELDLNSNELLPRRYWTITAHENGNHSFDYEAAKSELRSLLTDSTKRQMISDVPLGVFLSGGVDSPILTGLMAAVSSQPVKTFTVVFQGKDVDLYNEQDEARAVAQRFATEHHETTVDISRPLEMLQLLEHFDQPFGNPTFYLMYLISKAAREAVTVALSGAGGDELFAGYPRYRAMGMAKWFHWMPQPILEGAGKAMGLFTDDYRSATLRRARQFVGGLDADFAREFVNWTYFLKEDEKRLLLRSTGENGGYAPSDRIVRRFLAESGLHDQGNKVLHADVQTFLPDNVLEYTDKMSMAVSLEVRVPYLDYRLVEHSLALPFDYKLQGGRSKMLLKETFADLLPENTARAPKKGFNFPLAVWMRDYFDDYFDSTMNQQQVEKHAIFNWSYIQSLREEHRLGRNDHSYPLFSLITFDVWFRRHILGES